MNIQPSRQETTRLIRIIQLNTNRRNSTVHALLNDASTENTFDIALITEPWWGNIESGIEGPVLVMAAG